MLKFPKFVALTLLLATPAVAQEYGLGRVATPEEIAAWDIDVRPDGMGLPEGSGTVIDGEEVFAERCAVCHGDFGEAVGRWPVLAGGFGTLDSEDPVKTIGSYWPYLSTVFDYVNRAMPFGDAQSLTADEVYAITAYLLYVNDIVEDEDFELNHENFTDIRLENEDNFYMDDRAETELVVFTEACMTDCKAEAEITKRAAVIDVTPEETAANALRSAVEEVANAAATPKSAAEEEPAVEVAAVETPAIDPELVAAGEKVFKKCKACHQVGDGASNKTGPHLNGIVGMAAGAVEGFKYSKAFQDAAEGGLIWTDETLAEFLTKPKAFIPKTRMSFAGLRKDSDIAAVIAYLQSHQ